MRKEIKWKGEEGFREIRRREKGRGEHRGVVAREKVDTGPLTIP